MFYNSIKVILCFVLAFPVLSEPSAIVLYPDVPSPYKKIFSQIIDGIEDGLKIDELEIQAIKKTDNLDGYQKWVEDKQPDMLIALGRRSYTLTQKLDKNKNVVIGALPIKPNGISGVSLIADPKNLLESLKQLAPHIKRIHVVYSANSEWLIQLAEKHTKGLGLTLNTIKVENLKAAAVEYENLLSKVNVTADAIWLPLDPLTANEQVILPNLLKKSWDQNIVIFSSKPSHAKRGALFSMLPNHFELGQQLARMAKSNYLTKVKAKVVPLNSTQLAVNLRTASHLGLEYSSEQKESFHLTFPQ